MLYHLLLYGGDTIRVGFIGPGKVGVSLGRYFTQKGIKLTGFYGKNIKTTKEAANFTKSKFYTNIQDIITESDILFITTPDDIISIIDRELSKFDLNNKSICHTSGSIQSNVLCNAKHSGALIYSIHPIFAFSKKDTPIEQLDKIYFSIEGDILKNSRIDKNTEDFKIPAINGVTTENIAISVIELIKSLGNKFFIRDKASSSTYHLANVLVSNLILSLLEIGITYFKELGLNEKEAIDAISPLVYGNINNIFEKGFVNSLTGPVVRGDVKPIEKHLSVLKDKDKGLYKILSINLLNLVALKKCQSAETISSKVLNETNFISKSHTLTINKENAIKNLLNKSEKHWEIYKLLGGLE